MNSSEKGMTLRVEELGELGGDLAGSSGSSPEAVSAWLRGIDVDSFSSAIFFALHTFFGSVSNDIYTIKIKIGRSSKFQA